MADNSVKLDPLEAAKTWLASMPGKGPEFEDVAEDLAALLRHFIFCGESAMREEIASAFESANVALPPMTERDLREQLATFVRSLKTSTQKAAH